MSRGLGDVYKRQRPLQPPSATAQRTRSAAATTIMVTPAALSCAIARSAARKGESVCVFRTGCATRRPRVSACACSRHVATRSHDFWGTSGTSARRMRELDEKRALAASSRRPDRLAVSLNLRRRDAEAMLPLSSTTLRVTRRRLLSGFGRRDSFARSQSITSPPGLGAAGGFVALGARDVAVDDIDGAADDTLSTSCV